MSHGKFALGIHVLTKPLALDAVTGRLRASLLQAVEAGHLCLRTSVFPHGLLQSGQALLGATFLVMSVVARLTRSPYGTAMRALR